MRKKSADKYRNAEDFSNHIQRLLKRKQVIRESLPGSGRIHIDTTLPFLCVYRNPSVGKDEGTKELLYGTASYITSGTFPQTEFKNLIALIGKTLSEFFHSFLILEIWSEQNNFINSFSPKKMGQSLTNSNLFESITPSFRIFSNDRTEGGVSTTLEVLKTELSKISVHKKGALSELLFSKSIAPPKLKPLISVGDLKKINCHLAGLAVKPVYRNVLTGNLYNTILASLSRQMIYAFNRAFFEFTNKLTTHKAHHFYELGRRTIGRNEALADRKLAELCDSYDFLIQVSPINEAEARAGFSKNKHQKLPVFYYRPLAIDATEFKRILWNIPIEKIEDPALRNLFIDKREEIDLQISMMVNLDTPQFHYGSLQLYGKVDKNLSDFARKILTIFSSKNSSAINKKVNAADFYKHVIDEYKYYAAEYTSFTPEVIINKNMYSGIMVSKNKLIIGKEFSVSQSRMQSLIHHEVGTHLITYYNGLAQPFRQLHTGLSGYEELQEGLAVLSEYLSDGLDASRLRMLAARARTAEDMVDGADFIESFHNLVNNYDFSEDRAFTTVMRIYRGGGLTKDIIYLRGFLEILKYIENGGDIKPLYIGKFSLSQFPIIEELKMRKILKPAPLQPRFLNETKPLQRLKELSNRFTLTDYFKKLKQQTA